MTTRNFVLVIDKSTPNHIVRKIGQTLVDLEEHGIQSAARTYEALLHDINLGICDNALLKTELDAGPVLSLLEDRLGKDFRYCKIQWV